jgi:hypothetical protein
MDQLRVAGEVQSPRVFSFADLAVLPRQVPDIGTRIPANTLLPLSPL